jgi:ElaA protein
MLKSQQVVSKSYHELSKTELYAILSLRMQVFCVEQNCPYQDIDFQDQQSHHFFIQHQETICAYARVIPDEINKFHIGRVVVDENFRGKQLATVIMQNCIDYCQAKSANTLIEVSAQSYLDRFYKDLGFKNTGKYYQEDDIPHQQMQLISDHTSV